MLEGKRNFLCTYEFGGGNTSLAGEHYAAGCDNFVQLTDSTQNFKTCPTLL
jgi:hypothetical protein